jgi:hypothetical protein
MAHDCEPAEAECRAAMGAGLSAELGLFGTLREQSHGTQLVRLRLFRTSNGESVGEAEREVDVDALDVGALQQVAASMLLSLRGLDEEPEPPEAVPTPAIDEAAADEPADGPEEAEPAPDEASSGGPGAGEVIGYGLLGVSAVSIGLTI